MCQPLQPIGLPDRERSPSAFPPQNLFLEINFYLLCLCILPSQCEPFLSGEAQQSYYSLTTDEASNYQILKNEIQLAVAVLLSVLLQIITAGVTSLG